VASLTPSQAKETATANTVKKIVILGLRRLRQVDLVELDLDRPPMTIISPSTYNDKDGSLQGEADAICQENN